jgi:hypothetical protein
MPTCSLLTFQKHTPIHSSDTWCRSKNRHQKDMCLDEIGLRAK